MLWATDIHLDHARPPERQKFFDAIKAAGDSEILVTGDIAQGNNIYKYLREFAAAVPDVGIYYVLGNHDYYHSSIHQVRARMASLSEEVGNLCYLPAVGPLDFEDSTYLIGVDGWADATFGDVAGTMVWLSDFETIEDLKPYANMGRRSGLHRKLKEIADGEADQLRQKLEAIPDDAKRIIVGTHVPPFKEAAWHMGNMSSPDFLPYFTCKVTGDVLKEFADEHPDISIDVYCGHTHGEGVTCPRKNLAVCTGRSQYGDPEVQEVEIL